MATALTAATVQGQTPVVEAPAAFGGRAALTEARGVSSGPTARTEAPAATGATVDADLNATVTQGQAPGAEALNDAEAAPDSAPGVHSPGPPGRNEAPADAGRSHRPR